MKCFGSLFGNGLEERRDLAIPKNEENQQGNLPQTQSSCGSRHFPEGARKSRFSSAAFEGVDDQLILTHLMLPKSTVTKFHGFPIPLIEKT